MLPIGFVSDLEEKVQSFGMEVNVDWLCHQPLPLTHPHYDHELVSTLTIAPFGNYLYHLLVVIESNSRSFLYFKRTTSQLLWL
jgi:hypothetical protein